ncbi:hypothetical protein ACHAWF_011304 [Thalassiosira exigua]
MLLTEEDILFFGLSYVGFGEARQHVRMSMNIDRFKAHFGPDPRTVKDILLDLKEDFASNIVYKDVMMAMNWLKLYDCEHVLSGRWKYSERYLYPVIQENTAKLQSLFPQVVLFAGFDGREIHWVSVDTTGMDVQELRLNPDTKCFNPKTHGTGFKYELALALRRDELAWMNGPVPAGLVQDGTLFCGGNLNQPKQDWDKRALYFKLPPGKKAIADSAYKGIPEKVTVALDGQSKTAKDFLNAAKARQENYNWRLKTYSVLRHRFRHGKSTEDKLEKHKMCVQAVCAIVQYDLRHNPLMQLIGKIKDD